MSEEQIDSGNLDGLALLLRCDPSLSDDLAVGLAEPVDDLTTQAWLDWGAIGTADPT